jgi:hypothetical protein
LPSVTVAQTTRKKGQSAGSNLTVQNCNFGFRIQRQISGEQLGGGFKDGPVLQRSWIAL